MINYLFAQLSIPLTVPFYYFLSIFSVFVCVSREQFPNNSGFNGDGFN